MILVIDDDPSIVETLADYCGRYFPDDVRVVQCLSSEEAITAIEQECPEYVFTDHVLNGHGTGLDVIRYCQGAPITFFSISGGMNAEAEEQYQLLGIERFNKNNPRLMAAKIREILSAPHTL